MILAGTEKLASPLMGVAIITKRDGHEPVIVARYMIPDTLQCRSEQLRRAIATGKMVNVDGIADEIARAFTDWTETLIEQQYAITDADTTVFVVPLQFNLADMGEVVKCPR